MARCTRLNCRIGGLTMNKPEWNGNEGHTLTDIQEYNNRLAFQGKILKIIVGLGTSFLAFLVFVLYQIMKHDLFTVWIRSCIQ